MSTSTKNQHLAMLIYPTYRIIIVGFIIQHQYKCRLETKKDCHQLDCKSQNQSIIINQQVSIVPFQNCGCGWQAIHKTKIHVHEALGCIAKSYTFVTDNN